MRKARRYWLIALPPAAEIKVGGVVIGEVDAGKVREQPPVTKGAHDIDLQRFAEAAFSESNTGVTSLMSQRAETNLSKTPGVIGAAAIGTARRANATISNDLRRLRSEGREDLSSNSFERSRAGRHGWSLLETSFMPRLPIAAIFLFSLISSVPAWGETAEPAHENARMAQIFADDQSIRAGISAGQRPDRALVERMHAEDAARRAEVRTLLDEGALQTAEDFRKAAFVFQHGTQSDDYLLAHSLAVVSASKGSTEASWIAAASLDRYLQMKGEPQIYGTQTVARQGEAPTADPFNRELIPDSLRTAMGVPTLAEQQTKLDAVRAAVEAARASKVVDAPASVIHSAPETRH